MLSFEIFWEKKNLFSCLCSVEFPLRYRKVKTKAKCVAAKRAETCNKNQSHLTKTDLMSHLRIVNPPVQVQPVSLWQEASLET